jgi:hypothetical protein
MITKCHFHFGDLKTHQRCEQSFEERDIHLHQPVFSTVSNETFKNQDCAVCNGEPVDTLIPWKPTLVCSSKRTLMKRRSFAELQSAVFQNNSVCNIVYIPPPSIQTTGCVDKEFYIGSCNESGQWETFDDKILSACHADVVNVYLDCSLPYERRLFKNIFCAMCNTPDWINGLAIECLTSINLFENIASNLVSFTALIDLGDKGKVEIPHEGTVCSSDSLYESRVVS